MKGSMTASCSSQNSSISSERMWAVVDRLQCTQTRASTKANYTQIWKQFNKFLIKLDVIPSSWEKRALLFSAHLVECGVKSSTIRCYISAIKHLVKMDNYEWNDCSMLLNSVTRACRIINDKVYQRFPINIGLLEVLLFEINRVFAEQSYLRTLYKSIFCVAYYGLLRISEVADRREVSASKHAIKAVNVHLGLNKDKILLVLFSSKTHGEESHPQQIKIEANCQGITFDTPITIKAEPSDRPAVRPTAI